MKINGVHQKRFSFVALIFLSLLLCYTNVVWASSGGGGEGEAQGKGWVATDTYKVMNFAVLAVGLFFILRKPLSKALNARIDGIKEELEELESKKREAEKELSAYNIKMESLDAEADKILAEYIKQGEEAKARILQEAEATASKLKDQSNRSIQFEYEEAKTRLRSEVLELALNKAEKIIKQKITSDDQESLVDDYLKKVVA